MHNVNSTLETLILEKPLIQTVLVLLDCADDLKRLIGMARILVTTTADCEGSICLECLAERSCCLQRIQTSLLQVGQFGLRFGVTVEERSACFH